MATFKIPKKTLQLMDRFQRNFWWAHGVDEQKFPYLNWNVFLKSKEEGGLGVRDMNVVNCAMLGKLVWRFITEPELAWVKLLKARYLKGADFWSHKSPQTASCIWKGILSIRDCIKNNVIWIIGDGCSVNIWQDPWVLLPGYRLILTESSHNRVSQVNEWNVLLTQEIFSELERYVQSFQLSYPLFPVLTALFGAVWFASPMGLHFEGSSSTLESVLLQWLEHDTGSEAFRLGLCIMWSLWKARNRLVFEQIQPDIHRIIDAACSLEKEYSEPFSESIDLQQSLQATAPIQRWSPPTGTAIKINVDGGFILPKCSAAAVARNSDGEFLGCSTLISTCTSPLEAEAIAFRLGSQFASRFEVDHVIIEGSPENGSATPSPSSRTLSFVFYLSVSRLFHSLYLSYLSPALK
ncbi:hypothetical protein BVC80_1765g3 [Macleaya cordata]|uniref:RNase H type-1 domain-containing protein n=1 Tax=Macleaya cordata TaxID=56857 RepID=A0A200QTE2_MACCD|nr:hypothetical protein BVC80_1765g3 [Macleaya cordata]